MRDKRISKIRQHIDIFLNDQKFKVLSYKIDMNGGYLSFKTKVFGQDFPHDGRFTITIPTKNIMQDVCISFRSMSSNTVLEHWEYTIMPG